MAEHEVRLYHHIPCIPFNVSAGSGFDKLNARTKTLESCGFQTIHCLNQNWRIFHSQSNTIISPFLPNMEMPLFDFSNEIFCHGLSSFKCDYILVRKGINSKFQPVQCLEIACDLLKTFSLWWYIKESFNRKFNFLSSVTRRPGEYCLFIYFLCGFRFRRIYRGTK